MSETTPELRVGDRERRAVDARLQEAVGDGVLTLHEYDERSALLWRARTRTELDGLVADLPSTVPARPVAPAAPGGRTRRAVAIMSEDRLTGPVGPGQDVQAYAVMGKAVVDLRRADLPDGVRVQVRSLMGEVEVQVPVGSNVHLSGFTLMGERKVQVGAGDGPVVHVDAVAVMGTVKVTPGDGTVVPAAHGSGWHGAHLPAARRPVGEDAPTSRALARSGSGGGLRRLLRRGKGLLVPAAVLGAVLLAGPDSTSIFGSSVERVTEDDRSVGVSMLFGSVTVVVPDGARVETSGLVVFGSTDCELACSTAGSGPPFSVRSLGGFGSVEIVTESEFAAEQADDDRDDD